MNRDGNPQTLVPAHPGNTHRLVHGLYSKREIAPEVRDLADELMTLPHVAETDYAAALEIAKLELLIDRIAPHSQTDAWSAAWRSALWSTSAAGSRCSLNAGTQPSA